MFRVEPTEGDHWKIVDQNDNTVFVGTMREAEEWLDCRDNLYRRPATAGGTMTSDGSLHVDKVSPLSGS